MTDIDKLKRQLEAATGTARTQLETQLSEVNRRIEKEVTTVGRTPEDVEAAAGATAGARLTAAERQKALEYLVDDTVSQRSLSSTLRAAREATGVTGVRGAVGRSLGGLLQQVDPKWSAVLRPLLEGATPEQIQRYRVQAEALVAQNIPVIAGEESGRYTDVERRLTSLAVAAAAPGASQPQVIAALEELYKLKILTRQGKLVAAGREFEYDLTRNEGVAAAVADLRERGLGDEAIYDLLTNLAALYEDLDRERAARNAGR